MKIGTHIRNRRIELGWSQESVLCAMDRSVMGINRSQATYSNWENDNSTPSIPQLFKLAETLQTTAAALLTGKPDEPTKKEAIPDNTETEHWRTIAEERGERCSVDKKLIERLEQENEQLRKKVEQLEKELKTIS